ncbi:hypothetical protein LguiB_014036 [Lonicera macranthoides]
MLHGLIEEGKCGAVGELFSETLAGGQSPNLCTYRILIDGLCKNRQVAEA